MSKNKIILLHGALGSAEQMAGLSSLLSADYDVYTFDFVGHGGQNLPPQGFTIHTLTDQLADFIKTNDLTAAPVFGYSMGGYVALDLAMRQDSLASPGSILTLGTKFDWSPALASREAALLNPEKWEAKIPQFAEMLRQRHAPQDWKPLVKATADMMLDLGNGSAFIYEDLTRVHQPVFIMVGELDNMVSWEESQMAAEHLPNGQCLRLPNVKHPFEQIDQTALALLIKKNLSFSSH
jgi:pimeloyl-ACP methyl ester carboxylesterase